MQNLVITISRQVGSGGRLVGEKLALGLGVPFYDRKPYIPMSYNRPPQSRNRLDLKSRFYKT